MPPAKGTSFTTDEKLAFLMTCIKHSSTNLAVDLEAVAKEVKVCDNNKESAYWRLFRLMREYGLNTSGNLYGYGKGGSATPRKAKPSPKEVAETKNETPTKKKSTNKRKRSRAQIDTDDDEALVGAARKQVKVEDEDELFRGSF